MIKKSHLLHVGIVFILTTVAWSLFAEKIRSRTSYFDNSLRHEVSTLWGDELIQKAPRFWLKIPGTKRTRPVLPSSNQLRIKLNLDFRRKGLFWYSTFTSEFHATYELHNPDAVRQQIRTHFNFPLPDATYDQLRIGLDGEALEIPINPREGLYTVIDVPPGQSRTLSITYHTRGMSEWQYQFNQKLGRVRDLDAQIEVNVLDIDFIEGSLSPTKKVLEGENTRLIWQAKDLLTSQGISVVMPERLNPGQLSARLTRFAPICLLFFFILLLSLDLVYKVNIHVVHYAFVSAGFFTFHLLFAYLIGLINVHLAFFISAITSVLLVSLYLRAALSKNFPWLLAFAGQFFYLVLFSYSFFLQGMTGLTVTIGSVVTLAVLMTVTAKVDWHQSLAPSVTKKH